MATADRYVFGVRSKYGTKILEYDPFTEGAEIPLAEGEELFLYPTRHGLARATRNRDRAFDRQHKESLWILVLSAYTLGASIIALTYFAGLW